MVTIITTQEHYNLFVLPVTLGMDSVTRCPNLIGMVLIFWALFYIGAYYPSPPDPIFYACYLVTVDMEAS